MIKLKPALQQSEGRSKPWSGSTLVNAFAEKSQGEQQDTYAIMAVPGLTTFATLPTTPIRGEHRMANVLYAVGGSILYSVAADGTYVALGTIVGDGPVQMADNGTELAIVGGTVGYVLSAGVVSQPVNLPAVTSVIYIDGYFLWTVAGGDQFVISGLDDGLTYDPLDVATVEGDPDALVGALNSHREVLFQGTDTTEVWYNSGAADFPFERQGNAFVERGCIDRNSSVKMDSSVYTVGEDRIVYRFDGYIPVRVSNHAIEYRLATATYFRAFTMSQEGHEFYILNTDNGSFGFDVATQLWHERLSYGRSNYRCICATTAYGQTIMGDAVFGRLYTPSLDVYGEDGDPMPIVIALPTIERDRDLLTLYALELYCETGVGTIVDPNPQAVMAYSKDGGRTWSNDMARSLGAIGSYATRAIWRPGTQFRRLDVRFTLPSATRRLVMGYRADIR